MNTFVKKSFLFLLPFLILLIIEALIDPFNYFSEEKNPDLLKIKDDISQQVNPCLYKLIQYDRNPCSTIILGDSRIALLFPALFRNNNHENVSNLAIGGASLQDVIKIFWYLCSKHKIKKIYFGISLETYSGTLLRDRATPSVEIKNSFLLYLLNQYTFEATFLICKERMLNVPINLNKPPFTKDVFWKNQINVAARYLGNYFYPQNYYRELKKVSGYCADHNMELVFVLSPTHIELQNKIHEFNLDEQDKRFKHDIESFGDVYDFNYPNILTINKNNFHDPFHHNDSISRIIVNEISTNEIKYARFTSCLKKHSTLK